MEKMKLLTVFLLCLGIAGTAWSTEVISVDLNGDDYAAYTGMAVYPDAEDVAWRAYYTGTGKPMGSARSANLPDYDEPNIPSTYAAGVWITDANVSEHTYLTGVDLMDDGFDADVGQSPSLSIFAAAGGDANNRDGRAFGGTFDIYVYGATSGTFTLSTPVYGPNAHSITGGYTGTFVEHQNYTVFENVLIDDTNAATLAYDGQINGLQMVSHKQPAAISDGIYLEAEDYDVAYETNGRDDDPGATRLGADIGTYDDTFNSTAIGYLNWNESMTYDITVAPGDEGVYLLQGFVNTVNGDCNNLKIYLDDDIEIGTLFLLGDTGGEFSGTNKINVRLFEGEHTLRWVSEGPAIYFDLDSFYFDQDVTDPNFEFCDQVYQYGYGYENDFDDDCDVDANDLAYITGDNWLYCYSPDANDCL